MAGGQERSDKITDQDIIRLASPIFYEIDIFDLQNEKQETSRLIANKCVYLISSFYPNKSICGKVVIGYTSDDGILYNEDKTHRIMILPGDYYIFVSEKPLENYMNKINKNICSGPITIVSETNEYFSPRKGVMYYSKKVYVERLFSSSFKIGDFSNRAQEIRPEIGKEMIVRRYGMDRNNTNAIFLIGRIHGNEDGAEKSIKIMENFIKENPFIVPADTTVFILNPASNTKFRRIHRNINEKKENPDTNTTISIDPNRNFLDSDILRLEETKAIAFFTRRISQWKNITIISAHQYNDDVKDREYGKGYVFPLYELTDNGFIKIKKNVNSEVYLEEVDLEIGAHYKCHEASETIATSFSNIVKFIYEPMWKYKESTNKSEMYPGEYLFFVSRLNKELKNNNKSIRMIEYEVPESDINIKNNTTIKGLNDFIQILLGEYYESKN